MSVKKTSISDSMETMGDATSRLEFLKEQIQKQGYVEPEQREEIKALQREIRLSASRIPQMVGNKSVIIP